MSILLNPHQLEGCCCSGRLCCLSTQVRLFFLFLFFCFRNRSFNSKTLTALSVVLKSTNAAAPELQNAYTVQTALSMPNVRRDKVLKLGILEDNGMHAKFTCIWERWWTLSHDALLHKWNGEAVWSWRQIKTICATAPSEKQSGGCGGEGRGGEGRGLLHIQFSSLTPSGEKCKKSPSPLPRLWQLLSFFLNHPIKSKHTLWN